MKNSNDFNINDFINIIMKWMGNSCSSDTSTFASHIIFKLINLNKNYLLKDNESNKYNIINFIIDLGKKKLNFRYFKRNI